MKNIGTKTKVGYKIIQMEVPVIQESDGLYSKKKVQQPQTVYEVTKQFAALQQESFIVLTLDGKNQMIDAFPVTLGILNATLVHPREIFRKAICQNAHCIILVHNHPSGDTSPSHEDLRITRQMVEAGKILDIKVLDHVIIALPNLEKPVNFLSMRESGVIAFD